VHRHGRRQFLRAALALTSLGLLAGCGSLAARLQQPKRVPLIGYLSLGSPADAAASVDAFRQGLHELGYAEGRDVAIEYRYAGGGVDQLPALAAELVRLPADVIVARGTPPALATKDATATIPVVAAPVGDPVGLGLVASTARPGGNVTGLTNLGPGLSAKRLELLKEAVPSASRVAALLNLTNPSAAPHLRETLGAAQKLGVRVQPLEVRGTEDFERAFEAATREHAEALVTHADALFFQYRAQLVGLTLRGRLAGVFPEREFVEAGGLLAYGANIPDIFRRAAAYVDKILKGASPADLPVEAPTKFDLVVNLGTAGALGLAIPPAVLQQATEIIQ
jgi:ABC-type uncharacterized transport system substrate-binding protein